MTDYKKRERSSNWTEQEKIALVQHVIEREGELFGNLKGSGQAVKDRELVWTEITNVVNSVGNVMRNKEQVKKQFDNIKQQVKKYLDITRHPPTGGGRGPTPPTICQNLLLDHWKGRPGMGGLPTGLDTEDQNLTEAIMETVALSTTLEVEEVVKTCNTALESIASFPTTSASLGASVVAAGSCPENTTSCNPRKKRKRLALS